MVFLLVIFYYQDKKEGCQLRMLKKETELLYKYCEQDESFKSIYEQIYDWLLGQFGIDRNNIRINASKEITIPAVDRIAIKAAFLLAKRLGWSKVIHSSTLRSSYSRSGKPSRRYGKTHKRIGLLDDIGNSYLEHISNFPNYENGTGTLIRLITTYSNINNSRKIRKICYSHGYFNVQNSAGYSKMFHNSFDCEIERY